MGWGLCFERDGGASKAGQSSRGVAKLAMQRIAWVGRFAIDGACDVANGLVHACARAVYDSKVIRKVARMPHAHEKWYTILIYDSLHDSQAKPMASWGPVDP